MSPQPLSTIIKLDGYIQSIYLVVYPNKLLLLDGCCRADIPMLLNHIQYTLKRPLHQLKVVMVSHMHADHAGGATFLKKHTGCLIVSANKPRQWYHGIGGRVMHLIDTSLAYYVARRMGKRPKNLWYPAHLSPDITVKDGDNIPYFEDWQVIETAGHTDRDLSFFHKPSRIVYTADLIIKLKHKFVAPFPIYNAQQYQKSLIKIQTLKPNEVLMAHGGRMSIDNATFNDLINHAPRNNRTVKDTIKHKLIWWKKSS